MCVGTCSCAPNLDVYGFVHSLISLRQQVVSTLESLHRVFSTQRHSSVHILCLHCIQVKTALANKVDSFSFTLDQLRDFQELKECVAQSKGYVEGLQDFAMAEASREVSF